MAVCNFYQILRWVARRILVLLLQKECWAPGHEVNETSHPFCPHQFPADGESGDLHFRYLSWRWDIQCAGVLETEA